MSDEWLAKNRVFLSLIDVEFDGLSNEGGEFHILKARFFATDEKLEKRVKVKKSVCSPTIRKSLENGKTGVGTCVVSEKTTLHQFALNHV